MKCWPGAAKRPLKAQNWSAFNAWGLRIIGFEVPGGDPFGPSGMRRR